MHSSIYQRAPLTHIPADILNLLDYESKAAEFVRADIMAHISGGSAHEITLKKNREAFDRIGIMPCALQDFSNPSCDLTLLGQHLPFPVLLAPTAYQTLVHPHGELATARAAEALHTPMICSTLSSYDLESIAHYNGVSSPDNSAKKWFQLYLQEDVSVTENLIKRAEDSGYAALVITLDAPVTGLRYRAQRAKFSLPQGISAENLRIYQTGQQSPLSDKLLPAGASLILDGMMSTAPTWKTLRLLQQQTSLPILLKGLINPADVIQAQQEGFAGVVISNHGGRSLDGLPATIDVLPGIRDAVGNHFPLLLDSGIRTGGDIFKALAAGANAVLVGRPIYYALAVAGALGVAHMLRTLREELELTMALAGCPTLADISPNLIFHHA